MAGGSIAYRDIGEYVDNAQHQTEEEIAQDTVGGETGTIDDERYEAQCQTVTQTAQQRPQRKNTGHKSYRQGSRHCQSIQNNNNNTELGGGENWLKRSGYKLT